MAKEVKLPAAVIPDDLDPLAAVVLQALPKISDEQRSGVSSGDHDIDMTITIRVAGKLKIGADTTTTQVNKLKPWTLAKLLANHVSADVLNDCIDQALRAAKGSDAAVDAMEAEADALKARAEAVFEQAGMTVSVPRKGSAKLVGELSVSVQEG